jgi:SAM-dependent methyltransferase
MPKPSQNPAENNVFERDWSAYYNAIVGRPPRETLIAALDRFEAEESAISSQFAIDLGCGDGRDTVELLRRGWRVLGIDGEQEAIARLQGRPDVNLDRLDTQVVRFEDVTLPTGVDLVNASFSLPFCPPEHFPVLWNKIVACLRSGGRFCGQLFGDRDSWAIYSSMNHHTREQLEQLLQPFEVEMLEEEEHLGKTAIGEVKYWHLYQLVVRKR